MSTDSTPNFSELARWISGRLPVAGSWVVRYRALGDQLLPPFPCTALHGAFGRALKERVCHYSDRLTCAGCEALHRCSYPLLCEPPPVTGSDRGVVAQAPAPLVFAPDAIQPGSGPVPLRQGETIEFRVVLLGEAALARQDKVFQALEAVAVRGLGVTPALTARHQRPRLRLESVSVLAPRRHRLRPGNRCILEWLSPLRLEERHIPVRTLTASTLAGALWRRADLLCRLYGAGPLTAKPGPNGELIALPGTTEPMMATVVALCRGEQLRIVKDQTRELRVDRHSSRQNRRMSWSGLVGRLELEGPAIAAIWPLLEFLEVAQLGKGTTFGCGRYVLEELPDSRASDSFEPRDHGTAADPCRSTCP